MKGFLNVERKSWVYTFEVNLSDNTYYYRFRDGQSWEINAAERTTCINGDSYNMFTVGECPHGSALPPEIVKKRSSKDARGLYRDFLIKTARGSLVGGQGQSLLPPKPNPHADSDSSDRDEEDAEDITVFQEYFNRLEEIFRAKNPDSLTKIDRLLKKNEGKEHELYLKVCDKYDWTPKKRYVFETRFGKEGDRTLQQEYHNRLLAVFQKHNPKMMSSIPKMIDKHIAADDLHEFYLKVCKKYAVRAKSEYVPQKKVNLNNKDARAWTKDECNRWITKNLFHYQSTLRDKFGTGSALVGLTAQQLERMEIKTGAERREILNAIAPLKRMAQTNDSQARTKRKSSKAKDAYYARHLGGSNRDGLDGLYDSITRDASFRALVDLMNK